MYPFTLWVADVGTLLVPARVRAVEPRHGRVERVPVPLLRDAGLQHVDVLDDLIDLDDRRGLLWRDLRQVYGAVEQPPAVLAVEDEKVAGDGVLGHGDVDELRIVDQVCTTTDHRRDGVHAHAPLVVPVGLHPNVRDLGPALHPGRVEGRVRELAHHGHGFGQHGLVGGVFVVALASRGQHRTQHQQSAQAAPARQVKQSHSLILRVTRRKHRAINSRFSSSTRKVTTYHK